MEEWKEYRVAEVIEDISMGPFGSNIKRDKEYGSRNISKKESRTSERE